MTKPRSVNKALAVITAIGLIASCTVDKSGFTFDDEEFAKVNGDGDGDGTGGMNGDGDGTGGMNGDGDGDATGGMTGDGDGDATGGMGGAGTGGGPSGPMPGDLRCQSPAVHQVQVYAGDDLWVNVGDACEFICVDAACTGSCSPGDTQCLSSVDSQFCDASGVWNEAPTCMYACDQETGACGGECVPGSKQCSGLQKQVCDESGAWQNDGTPCPNGCNDSGNGENAACTGGCTSGDTQCSSNKQQETCSSDGVWVPEPSECANVCINGACGGVCDPYAVPVQTRCNPNNGNQAQRCQAPQGIWGDAYNCENTCVDGPDDCGGVCKPGERDCFEGNVAQCNDQGQWEPELNCKEFSDEQGNPVGCRLADIGNEKLEPVCGNCNPSLSSGEPPRRCHTDEAGTHPDECKFSEGAAIWQRGNNCPEETFCYQGQCGANIGGLCEANPVASGCLDLGTQWRCDPNQPSKPIVNECGGVIPGVCEFDRCPMK